MKQQIKVGDTPFRSHQSFSPEEVLAAGGTTAFGLKTGKNNTTLIRALQESAEIEPFSDEEWGSLLDQLEKDK